MQPQDTLDPWGRLAYVAHPLRQLGAVSGAPEVMAEFGADPAIQMHPSWTDYWLNQSGVRVSVAYQDAAGACHFYGVKLHLVAEDILKRPNDYYRRWQIYRMRSDNGYALDEIELLYTGPSECPQPGRRWATGYWMERNGHTGRLHYYMYGYNPGEHGEAWLYGYSSPNGRDWSPVSDQSIYPVNHDNVCVMWDPRTGGFVAQQILNFENPHKPLIDNIRKRRRVLTVWTGPDGQHFNHVHTITPDHDDAPDVEIYRVSTFPYGDRYLALANLYAPSPLRPEVHGPHLYCEWWVSDDCVHWQRPWRGLEAQGGAPYTIEAAPVFVGGQMLWWINDQVWGLPEYRVAGVTAQSNAAFTTRPFSMPNHPLSLNATIPKRPRFFDQGYVMAELVDDKWATLPGYEAEKCLLREADGLALPLDWNGRTGIELAGRTVAVRFHFRGACLYALHNSDGN